MPEPEIVTVDDIPDRERPTRQRSSAQRLLDEQVARLADHIRSMGPSEAVRFHLSVDDDPGFGVSAATQTKIKDRYRRMFRIAIDTAGLRGVMPDGHEIRGTYRYHIETLPSGEYHSKEIEVWAVKVEAE